MKDIYNIVFYKYKINGIEYRDVCIFYNDGTIEQLPYMDGLKRLKDVANSLGVSKDDVDGLGKFINQEKIHVLSRSEFEDNFKKYMAPAEVVRASKKPETFEELIDRRLDDVEASVVTPKKDTTPKKTTTTTKETTTPKKAAAKAETPEVIPFVVDAGELGEIEIVVPDKAATEEKLAAVTPIASSTAKDTKKDTASNLASTSTRTTTSRKGKSTPKRKKGIGSKIAYGAAALALIFGLGAFAHGDIHLNKTAMEGAMNNSNIPVAAAPAVAGQDANQGSRVLANNTVHSNDYYDGYTYDQLLEVTDSQTQHDEMVRVHDALYGFNVTFADAHVEEGKDIRAALTFEEVIALSQAYNDFTPQEMAAIFNGYGFRSGELTDAYKVATLQLMGGHVIEDREHPVDMSMLLTTQEGKDFYNKYHELYLRVLESEGQEKIDAINAFYAELFSDFPISDDIREVGIAHADGRNSIKSYYLSVTPMVASMEMIAQNYNGIDHTMLDKAIAYFNDIGLCNRAEDNFEIVQQVTMGACVNEDDTNPLYTQYRDAMVNDLTNLDKYVTTDGRRNLADLKRFQDVVNWHAYVDGPWSYHGETYVTYEYDTETKRWTETTTREETTRTQKEMPAEVKEEIDKEIDKENEEAKRQGEEAAKKEEERLQDEADKDAERIEEEIRQDHEDMQNDIDDANAKIEENQRIDQENEGKPEEEQEKKDPVNEDDFGDHGVDFDDDHSNDNGDLDDSVENITTDDSGYVPDEPLPDPNVTGADFDAQYVAPTEVEVVDDSATTNSASGTIDVVPTDTYDAPVEEHHDSTPVETYDAPAEEAPAQQPTSNESAVDQYIESLTDEVIDDEDVIQYIRRN